MTTINAVRGIVNGASSASLLDMDHYQCTGTALKINHLLFSTASTLSQLGNPLNAMIALTACALTPIAMLADSQNVVPFSETTMKLLNNVYQTGIVVNCVAMLALGNPVFALSSLAVLALNATATGQVKNILDRVKKACSAIALAFCGAQIFESQGAVAKMAQMSAVLVGVKGLLSLLESMPKENVEPVVQKLEDLKLEELSQMVQKLEEEVVLSKKEILPEPVVEEPVHWLFKPMF